MPSNGKNADIELTTEPAKKSIMLTNLEMDDEILLSTVSGTIMVQSKASAKVYTLAMDKFASGMYTLKISNSLGKTKFLQMVLKRC